MSVSPCVLKLDPYIGMAILLINHIAKIQLKYILAIFTHKSGNTNVLHGVFRNPVNYFVSD